MDKSELLSYLKIIRKWWWIIAVLVAATLTTMLIIFVTSEPRFVATATVQVTAPPPQEVPLYSTSGREALSAEIIRTQTSLKELMEEGDVAYQVLRILPDIPMQGSELRQRIEIDIPEDSHLMRISVSAPDAEMAALLANAVVETSLTQYAELAAMPTAGMRTFIEEQLVLAQTLYESAEAELTQFQVANKIGSLNTAIDRQYDLIGTLKVNRDLAAANGDVGKTEAMNELIIEREAELQNMIGLSSEYYTLVGRVDRARDTYNFMLDKKAEAQIKENQILELASVQVITPARPPFRPTATLSPKIIVLGAIVSLLSGVLLAFLLEYLEREGAFQRVSGLGEPSPDGSSDAIAETQKVASIG